MLGLLTKYLHEQETNIGWTENNLDHITRGSLLGPEAVALKDGGGGGRTWSCQKEYHLEDMRSCRQD